MDTPTIFTTRTQYRHFPATADLISDLVTVGSRDPEVRKKALEITAPAGSGNWTDEAQLIFNFVRDEIRYTGDPSDEDIFQYPLLTLSNKAGDCNNRVILLGSLLRSIGFPVRVVYMFAEPFPNLETDYPRHVYLEIDITKNDFGKPRWVALETTPVPDPLTRQPTDFISFGDHFKGGFSLPMFVPIGAERYA